MEQIFRLNGEYIGFAYRQRLSGSSVYYPGWVGEVWRGDGASLDEPVDGCYVLRKGAPSEPSFRTTTE